MTKTAYAKRMSAEEFAERTKDLSPEEREQWRLEEVGNPLFDMWLRFCDVFADRAIDRLDVSDEDAEAMAKMMEGSTSMGDAYAYLLRCIPDRRIQRELHHKVSAIWAASGACDPLPIEEIHARYEKLPKGEA